MINCITCSTTGTKQELDKLEMDEETGEINHSLQVSKDAETGEEEYVNYWLDQETGEKQYFSLNRICHSLQMPHPFRINRYPQGT